MHLAQCERNAYNARLIENYIGLTQKKGVNLVLRHIKALQQWVGVILVHR